MGLSSALATAMSGLRANQAALSIIRRTSPTRRRPATSPRRPTRSRSPSGTPARRSGHRRQPPARSVRAEPAAHRDLRRRLCRPDRQHPGPACRASTARPGGDGTLETALNNFTTALQALSTSSGAVFGAGRRRCRRRSRWRSSSTRRRRASSRCAPMSSRTSATSASQANADMTQIAQHQHPAAGTEPERSAGRDADGSARQRHQRRWRSSWTSASSPTASNQTNIFTNSGIQLVGDGLASQLHLQFAGRADRDLAVQRQSRPNPASVRCTSSCRTARRSTWSPTTSISSGQIAADLKLRDQTLVQAQTQVDQLAATLASALSDKTTAGTAVTGPPAGFDVDISERAAGQHHQPDLHRHRDQHPAPDLDRQRHRSGRAAAAERRRRQSDSVVGVNFSGGMASVVSQLNTALGSDRSAVLQSVGLDAELGR